MGGQRGLEVFTGIPRGLALRTADIMVAKFPRCMSRLKRWYSHSVSFGSPVWRFILAPTSVMILWASGPKTPLVSNASGAKRKRSVRPLYFVRFLSSAVVAAAPGVSAELLSTV